MIISNMKNIVVLKDLPSNIVDEAIVVLKNTKKIKKLEFAKNNNIEEKLKAESKKENSKDYIVKEAEMLVTSYISEIERDNKNISQHKNLQKKYNKIKKLNKALIIIAFISIIAFLIK